MEPLRNVHEDHAVNVSLHNLRISISINNACILSRVTTTIRGASMFAILGGSGSGKTTLLNVIAGRFDPKMFNVEGTISFSKTGHIGYLTQHDYLLPFLTVHETVMFAAKLKISSPKSRSNEHAAMLNKLVEDAIMDLGLQESAHTRVGESSGTGGERGISGGEQRRLSIAIQIISNPKVLCADEPTSGLDSFTAITVIQSLKRMCDSAAHKTTVICSIHQPRRNVFDLFDGVLLLSKGGAPVYCGPVSEMVEYFHRLGHECLEHSNPADYFVDISSVDNGSVETRTIDKHRVEQLIEAFNKEFLAQKDHDITEVSVNTAFLATSSVSWWLQVVVLTQRFSKNSFRNIGFFFGTLVQVAVMSFILAAIFWRLSNSVEDIQSRKGLLYMAISMENYLLLVVSVERYGSDLKIFDRELQDKMYETSAYFVAHFLANLPLFLIIPILYSFPIYYGCNLRDTSVMLENFVGVNIVLSFTISALALLSVSCHRAFAVSSLIANTNYTFITLGAGFLLNFEEVPVYVGWVKYVSFLNYAYQIVMSAEFSDRVFPGCLSSQPNQCSQYNGNDILEGQSIGVNTYLAPWCALVAFPVAYYIIAAMLLEHLRYPPTGATAVAVVTDGLINSEEDDDDRRGSISEEDSSSSHTLTANNATLSKNAYTNQRMAADEENLMQSLHLSSPTSITVQNLSLYVRVHARSVGITPPVSIVGDTMRYHTVESTDNDVAVDNVAVYVDSAQEGGGDGTSSKIDCGIDDDHVSVGSPIPVEAVSSSSNLLSDQHTNNGTRQKFIKKRILNSISVTIPPGQLVALMGGSGSGKTTLLNIVAGRLCHELFNGERIQQNNRNDESSSIKSFFVPTSQYSGHGKVLYNNKFFSRSKLRNMIGYVQQFDFHLPSLTVWETLLFHAAMRLPSERTDLKRRQRVQQLLVTLDMCHCKHVRVGDESIKGISGGERRRLSLAVQLIADPPTLLLDEPTTGLDAFTARHVVSTLKSLSSQGRTVVVSIHQPRYDVYALIDRVILLSRGNLVWSGLTEDMLVHFESLGFPCPHMTNPADFILDLSSVDFRNPHSVIESRARLDKLIDAFVPVSAAAMMKEIKGDSGGTVAAAVGSAGNGELTAEHDTADVWNDKNILHTLPLLIKRSATNIGRQANLATVRISQGVFFALILACFYAPITSNQVGIQNRIGCLQELTALCYIGMLCCIAIYPYERSVFYREFVDGGYSASSFFLSYFCVATPFLIIVSFMISALMTFGVGLSESGPGFVIFTFVIFCFILVGEAIGIFFCALFMDIGVSVNLMSAVLGVFGVACGFSSLDMPQWVIDITMISPQYWGSYLLANVAFEDEEFSCSADEYTPLGTCPLSTGEEVLALYHMSNSGGDRGIDYHVLMLGVVTVCSILIAYAVFLLRAYKLRH